MAIRPPRPQRALHAPTTRPRARSALSVGHHIRLARRLTPRDRWLIRMLHEHRVLTTDQVTAMAFPSPRAARRRLLELYGWNVVDRFQPLVGVGSAPMHYVLGATGAAVLAAEEGITTAALGFRRDDVLAIAHRRTLAHTVAVNDVFAHLVHQSITTSSIADRSASTAFLLEAWWSETRCLRLVGEFARPDAYGRITLPPVLTAATAARAAADSRSFEWFFELDFGTEPLARLAAKLDGYAQLAAATHPTPVLIWLPSPRREAHAREYLTRALRRLERPDLVPVATTTPSALHYPPEIRQNPRGLLGPNLSSPHDPDAEDQGAVFEHADPGVLGWLPIDLDRHHSGTGHRRDGLRANDHRGAGTRRGLDGLAVRWPTVGGGIHAGVVAPDHARTRAVELPAPDPVPPDATINPATGHPAPIRPAMVNADTGRAARSPVTEHEVDIRRGGGCPG
jgi:hypothetical protein